jgi:hypothetical protein
MISTLNLTRTGDRIGTLNTPQPIKTTKTPSSLNYQKFKGPQIVIKEVQPKHINP